MLPYFPFSHRFNDKMGTAPLSDSDRLIDVDQHYESELTLKRQLLRALPAYYFRALPGYEEAQWEVVELLLPRVAQAFPHAFSVKQQAHGWHWTNALLNEAFDFTPGDAASLPLMPLDWMGRQVQEDLLLLAEESVRLVAGSLCFANDWSLEEKLGLPFWQIHAPINGIVEPMMRAAQTLMERLPPGRTVWRLNWSIKVSNQLDMSTRHLPSLKALLAERLTTLTPATIGEQLVVRIERQTLTRLPRSGAVLFTVRTYQNLLAHEASDPERAWHMAQVFRTTPPALLAYKSMTGFMPMLLHYLNSRQSAINSS